LRVASIAATLVLAIATPATVAAIDATSVAETADTTTDPFTDPD